MFPQHFLSDLATENTLSRKGRRGSPYLNGIATIANPQSSPSARMIDVKVLLAAIAP